MRLHNTLTKVAEEFVSRHSGQVAMYVCGPTVWDRSHLGHMRAAIVFDVLRRYLEAKGFQVTHIQNITDVDDRIIHRAEAEGVSTQAIADRYIEEYRQARRALNILPPHGEPQASHHIPEIIAMIRRLIERGFAYHADGDVYFDVTKFPRYGRLSGKVLDELKAGARVEPGEAKRHPADFALWKQAKPGEPSWESPWGRGRPGWHIECSAMSLRYLGMGFDIHGGGDDLVFPHHENEIAQSEAYVGAAPFVRYWVHNAMVTVSGEKMSKSLQNYFAVTEALKRYPSDVIRYALGAVHYRKPMEIDRDRLEDAGRAVDRLRAALASIDAVVRRAEARGVDGEPSDSLRQVAAQARAAFVAAMDDDLNTSGALAAVFDLVAEVNRATDLVLKGNEQAVHLLPGLSEARDAILEMTGIIGLRFAPPATDEEGHRRLRQLAADLQKEAAHLFAKEPGATFEDLVAFILAGRERARAKKDFTTADQIRKRLAEAGVLVEDLPTGPRWRIATSAGRYSLLDAADNGR